LATVDLTRRPPLAEYVPGRVATAAALAGLVGLSLLLRATQLPAGFWIDEGISVGIAHHHWTSIPPLLRQDGSPPAYYMLLGLWIRVFGDGEAATHALSLVFTLASIPVAYAAGRSIFDRRTGFICALLVAVTPYLTYYAQETRMYSFEAFLSLVAALAYVNGVVRGRRGWAALLVPTLALMVYGHNWALFFCAALALTTVLFARDRIRIFALVAAGVAVLYLPWLPTLLSQARHTGAPWSTRPSFHELFTAAGAVLGGDAPFIAFVVAAAAGGLAYRHSRLERLLAILIGATVLFAWVASQISPAWTTRYFSVVLGPVVLLAAAIVTRSGRAGTVALVAVLFLWWGFSVKNEKENAKQIAAQLAPFVHPGELVISTHPEQVPVLRYYLGGGLRWATSLGPVADAQVFDWRDAVSRLKAAQPRATLDPLIASVPRGQELVVVVPVFRDYRAWKASWTRLVWQRSLEWSALLQHDPRLRLEHHFVTDEIAVKRNYFKPVQAFVYRRVG
jgi:mannosyltransferase